CTARSTPAQNGLRMVLLSVFPAAVFGISHRKSTDFGDFTPPRRVLQCAMTASSPRDSPSRSTTIAFTASPHFSSGTPITAHSRTCESSITQAATSQALRMIARGRRRDRRGIEKRHVHGRFGLPVGLAQARAKYFNALFEFVR